MIYNVDCTAPDGTVYHADLKRAWGKRCFSLDGGATWHRSAKKARLDAEARGFVRQGAEYIQPGHTVSTPA